MLCPDVIIRDRHSNGQSPRADFWFRPQFQYVTKYHRQKQDWREGMGEKNDVFCAWLEKAKIFSDFMNGAMFAGKQKILSGELEPAG